MRKHDFDEYDREQLKKAQELLEKVYVYHYGDSYMRNKIKRLETILAKLEALQNM